MAVELMLTTVDLLARSTLVASLATLAVLAARRPLRRAAGARVVYASWLIVPFAMFALALPPPQLELDVTSTVTAAAGRAERASAAIASADTPWPIDTGLMLVAWLIGCAVTASRFLHQQTRFRRRIGRTKKRDDGSLTASTRLIGPAVLGLFRPRIIVPLDFEQRYDAEQRALILAHESVHCHRGDLFANLAVTALRCVYWFNPLLHLASRCFRADQELACDAVVLARFPESRRRYADAILKTQLADLGLPVGCTWQSSHPLKERISMLNSPAPGARRTLAGVSAVLTATIGCASAVWATQPPTVHVRAASDDTIDPTPNSRRWQALSEDQFAEFVESGSFTRSPPITDTSNALVLTEEEVAEALANGTFTAIAPPTEIADESDIAVPASIKWADDFVVKQRLWASRTSESIQMRILVTEAGGFHEFTFSVPDIPSRPEFTELLDGLYAARIKPALGHDAKPLNAWTTVALQAPPALAAVQP